MKRRNERKTLRPVKITRHFTKNAPGSVLFEAGKTVVLCTASFETGVPRWREGSGLGWVTAEYDMLPASTHTRRSRNRNRVDGRTQEIQRLIGRCMRSVVDMSLLGENSIVIDCDVLQADGGTRTASITGGFVALADAVTYGLRHKMLSKNCILDHVAAVSVGLLDGQPVLDLDYLEDSEAEVDLNLAMTGQNRIIEVQGTGEKTTFSRVQLGKMLEFGSGGIRRLIALQKKSLSSRAKTIRS